MIPLRVLILEDRPSDAQLMLHELRNCGFEPQWERVDTEEEYVSCLTPTLDVILADHSLPRFNSIRALQLLQERQLDIPFIVVSGAIGEDVAVSAMKAGATDYLLKDRLARLGPAVAQAVRQHTLRNEKRRVDQRLTTALRQYTERLNILHQIDQATLTAQSPEAVANAVLARIREVVPCQLATVVLFDFGKQEFTILAVHTRGDPQRGESQLPAGTRLPLAAYGELHVEALRGQKVHTAEDILSLFSAPLTIEMLPPQQLRAAINLPLIAEGKLMGALNLVADEVTTFDAGHLEITHEIADPLAVAIHQAQLREQVTQHTSDLERRVAARTAELQQSNAELEAFAYTVSHDLRAPLRAIQGFADALMEDYGNALTTTAHDYTQRILGAAQRMDRLIQDVLAYSRVGFGELQLTPVELDAVLADVLAQLDGELRKRGASVVSEPLPAVIAHRATLAQVLANLLTNAVKFVAPDVQPQIRIRATDGTVLRSAAPGAASAGSVRVWIEDNGIGIAPEYWEKVFGVFERLHTASTYPGTGIGLAIVRKAITRMGGHAGVASEVGAGSRFWIELQRADT